MTTKKKSYNCSFNINPGEEIREFETLEKEASEIFLDFLNGKDYGKDIRIFCFTIYVMPSINFGLQNDTIYDKWALLVTHINKKVFDNSSQQEKIKLLLSTSYVLTKYLVEQVPLPKEFNSVTFLNDFKKYLTSRSLLIDHLIENGILYKYFETTRFNFIRTQTMEIDEKKIHFNLNEIEDAINNGIAGVTFGKSINSIGFGFELYDFNGSFADMLKKTQHYKRYGHKYKNYIVVKHFDFAVLKELEGKQQFGLLKSKILEGLNDYESLKKKPKDFEMKKFYQVIEGILNDYEKRHWY
jgi:hypothetical protein